MATAAVTLRFSGARPARRVPAATCGLAFDRIGGPVVAVCGLAGGAGTSTVALALASRATTESRAPVLLADAAEATGGLAHLAGARSPRPLTDLARLLVDGDAAGDTYTEFASGLRLVAAGPGPAGERDRVDTRAVLVQAREAHGLVVLDCGTKWLDDSAALAEADAVIWTMPATQLGVATARTILDARAAPNPTAHRELLVAREVAGADRVRVRSLRRVVEDRCDRVVLMRHDPRVATTTARDGALLEVLSAIAPMLHRAAAR